MRTLVLQERLIVVAIGLYVVAAVIQLLVSLLASHNYRPGVSSASIVDDRLRSILRSIARTTRKGRWSGNKRAGGHVLPPNGR